MLQLQRRSQVLFALFVGLIFFAFSSSHPVSSTGGYTGAPGDSQCTQCHSDNNTSLTGMVSIEGLPNILIPGSVLPLTVKVTNPSLNAARAGFQLVALDDNQMPVGSISNLGSNLAVKTASGRQYVGHQPAKSFLSTDEVVYDFDYEVPAAPTSSQSISFYVGAILANGSGDSNDRFVDTIEVRDLMPPPPSLSVSIVNVEETPCSNAAQGSAVAQASGGVAPYSYLWSNGVTDSLNTTLPAGVSTVTVTDADSNQVVDSLVISAPPTLELDIVELMPAPCDGMTGGSARVAATGGNGGYTYEWPQGLMGPIQPNLEVGSYVVTATDNMGCQVTQIVEVTAIPVMQLSAQYDSVLCNAVNTTSINLSLVGGSPPYVFNWLDGGTGERREDLPAGDYIVEVTDINSCQLRDTFSIIKADSLLVASAELQASTCSQEADGAITISVDGGLPPYTYLWSNGATSQNLSGLVSGDYSVTITDSIGCTVTEVYTLSAPDGLVVTLTDLQDVQCYGDSTGSITIVAEGGTPPYTFEWSDGGNGTGLTAGTYSVTVTDSSACRITADYTVAHQFEEVVLAVSATSESQAGAADGSANVIATGGLPPYTYQWSTGDTTRSISNLSQGVYFVTVTDDADCETIDTTIIGVGNCLLAVLPSIMDNPCPGDNQGAISLEIRNSPTPSILWSTGDTTSSLQGLSNGIYGVTVTDENNCEVVIDSLPISSPPPLDLEIQTIESIHCGGDTNILTYTINNPALLDSVVWLGGATSDTLRTEALGLITLSATDTVGCVSFDSIQLLDVDTIPPALIVSESPTLYLDTSGMVRPDISTLIEDIVESCAVDSVIIDVQLPVSIDPCTLIDSLITVEVSAFDRQGNSSALQVEATVADTLAPTVVSGADTIWLTSCHPVPPVDVVFEDNCGISASQVEVTLVDSILAPGRYEITGAAMDLAGNITTVAIPVIVRPAFEPAITVSPVSCFGQSDGSFTVDSLIGYNGAFSIDIDADSNLVAGTYGFTITDTTGCVFTDSFTIVSPAPLMVDTVVLNDASDSTLANGSIGLLISGGTPPYMYEWMDSEGNLVGMNSFLAAIPAGEYFFALSDFNGCTLRDTFVVGDGTIVSTESSLLSTVKIYPNPTSDIVTLAGLPPQTSVMIIDLAGQILYEGDRPRAIDLTSWPSGVYTILLQHNHQTLKHRLVVLR